MVKNKNKHICVLVSCLLAVMIAIIPLFTISNNKTTAKADAIISNQSLIVLPSFYFNPHPDLTYRDIFMPTMFLSVSDSDFKLYFVSSLDGVAGSYSLSPSSIPFNDWVNLNARVHFCYYTNEKNLETRFADFGYNNILRFRILRGSLSDITTVSIISDYFSEISAWGFTYVFEGVNNSEARLDIGNTPYDPELKDGDNYFNFTTIAAPADISSLNQYAIDSAYQRGYNDAYQTGYNHGLNTTWGDLSPWKAAVNGVDDFVSAPLFGNVSLKTLFLVAFGVILFGLFIKVFFGG